MNYLIQGFNSTTINNVSNGGSSGITGPTGATGATGATGSTGPTGASYLPSYFSARASDQIVTPLNRIQLGFPADELSPTISFTIPYTSVILNRPGVYYYNFQVSAASTSPGRNVGLRTIPSVVTNSFVVPISNTVINGSGMFTATSGMEVFLINSSPVNALSISAGIDPTSTPLVFNLFKVS